MERARLQSGSDPAFDWIQSPLWSLEVPDTDTQATGGSTPCQSSVQGLGHEEHLGMSEILSHSTQDKLDCGCCAPPVVEHPRQPGCSDL